MRSLPLKIPAAKYSLCSFTRRWRTRRSALNCCATFCFQSAIAKVTGRLKLSFRNKSNAFAKQSVIQAGWFAVFRVESTQLWLLHWYTKRLVIVKRVFLWTTVCCEKASLKQRSHYWINGCI